MGREVKGVYHGPGMRDSGERMRLMMKTAVRRRREGIKIAGERRSIADVLCAPPLRSYMLNLKCDRTCS